MPTTNSSSLVVIQRGYTEKNYWSEIWNYRDLFFVLAWRDVAVRYKQTIIGLAWALIQPLVTMVVFTVIFSKLAKLPSDGIAPYALMVYVGLLPWQLFSTSLTSASSSLIGNANLISKVYFPRLIVPTASMLVAVVDFFVGFLILGALMAWYQFTPSWSIVTLPFFVLMGFLASLGPGLWITAMNVKYRDFRYIIPFLVQLGLYVSPVGFSSSVVPQNWRLLYYCNPMVGVIDGFRWAILGEELTLDLLSMAVSWAFIVFFLWIGVKQFRRMERSFADHI
jgi:lipopolysaccharide transport system permease protein